MKMFRSLLSLFALVAVSSAGVLAQNAVVVASANVLNELTVAATNNTLSFGNFADNTIATQAVSNANVANLGEVTVSGMSVGESIDFTITAPDELTPAGAFDPLPYNPAAVVTTTEDTPGSPISGGTYDFTGSNTATVTTTTVAGPYYIYIGGDVDATGGGNYSGSYTGNITISVEYN